MTQRPTSSSDQFSASAGTSGFDASSTQPLGTTPGPAGTSQYGSSGAQALKTVDNVTDQAKQQASQIADQARQQVSSQLTSQKTRAADSLGSVAQALRQTGQQLRDQDQGPMPQYVERAADQIERLSGYLQNKDIGQLVDDVERYARRQPGLFLGGAFVLGLLGARFLKSSSPNASSGYGYGGDAYRTRQYSPGYPDTTAYGQGYTGTASYGGPADYGTGRSPSYGSTTGTTAGYGSTPGSTGSYGSATTGSTAGYGTGTTGYGTGATGTGSSYDATSSSTDRTSLDDTAANSARERGGTEGL